jgi:hypothetical protein
LLWIRKSGALPCGGLKKDGIEKEGENLEKSLTYGL